MITLFGKCGGADCFPIQGIAESWFIKPPNIALPPLLLLMHDENDKIQSMLSERSYDDDPDSYREENDDEIIGSAPASEEEAEAENTKEASGSDDEMEADKSGASTAQRSEDQHQRFCRVISIAKEGARKAATPEEQSENVVSYFCTLLASFVTAIDGEIRDISGRPKGRPPKRGHSRLHSAWPLHCPLCESDSHNLLYCQESAAFREEQLNFSPAGGGNRKCALRYHPGHRRDRCPVLKIAQRRIREELRSLGKKRP
jgi:hypothetical protein